MSVIRQRKIRLKRRGIIIGMVLFIVAIISLSSILYFNSRAEPDGEDRQEYKEEITIKDEMQAKPIKNLLREEIAADLRLHYYNNIKLSDKISIGDYIDIRISYENGMDFIVLPKKRVIDVSISNNNLESCIWLEVSEEEILRMSSAFVDLYHYERSVIYAVKYLNEAQNIAKANYPVNDEVRKLIDSDPNIINKGIHLKESIYRKVIDKLDHMSDALVEDTATWGEGSHTTNANDYDEDIVYLD
ncbi:hypothetical protein EDD66_11061 [Mobilisporobacter senegalensis]|uniref:Uncharacterized protein n=1 Tax=Mobilisporobacter senegalensis TaxID=1329262 RepID=A0A3N1XGC0_9FIRM|nr:hypothetical protein [Mobilisporobacter senegalensis]ROR25705.1 hypothetical protein EDD66_11061 [Mobilisporobacter senegalensis]